MNSVNLKCRIATEIKTYVNQDKGMIVFSVAIPNRAKKDANGNPTADFVQCVAYGNVAQTISTYLGKGDELALTGRLQSSSYEDKNGIQRRTTEVVVTEMFFCGSKKTSDASDSVKESKVSKKTA